MGDYIRSIGGVHDRRINGPLRRAVAAAYDQETGYPKRFPSAEGRLANRARGVKTWAYA